jgi:multiple sugar transport system substrate-binding protein
MSKKRDPRFRAIRALAVSATILVAAFGSAAAQEQPFKGTKVVIVANAGGNSDYMKLAAKEWEQQTGATVELNPIPFGDIQSKVLQAMSTGTYIGDILALPTGIAGSLIAGDYVIPVPEDAQQAMDLDDIPPAYRENLFWDGVQYAWPWDGDIFTLNYRADLLADAANQAEFEAEYGYPLAVPVTWQQYADIAAFFSGARKGVPHGWAEVAGRGQGSFHAFSARAVSYAKLPTDPGFYFDPDTMDARINNPGFVRALQDWIDALPSATPSVTTLGAFETHMAFIAGQVLFNIDWTDTGVMAQDPTMSAVAGKLGSAILPGSHEVWDSNAADWALFDEPNQPAYLAFGGWIIFIPENARNPEAAISLANYFSSPDVMRTASQTPNAGVNPVRTSTVNDLAGWVEGANFPSEDAARNYLDAMAIGENFVNQLRIPGENQYEEALELAISQALTAQRTPQEALDEAARTWNDITERLGREQQRSFYRATLGLPAD